MGRLRIHECENATSLECGNKVDFGIFNVDPPKPEMPEFDAEERG